MLVELGAVCLLALLADGDARWPQLLAAIDKANADFDKAIKEPALRKEILAMRDDDQKARFAWIAKQDD